MKKIDGLPKTLRQLFTGVKYTVHYYQREYLWGKKQIEELLEDLTSEFLDFYDESHTRKQVANYGHYFLGSIVLTKSNNETSIIDGQQRLTSLTLLLIYLNHLQKNHQQQVDIQNLIFSEQFGEKSFTINVDERKDCLNALFLEKDFNPEGQPESVRNLYARYLDIVELFPEGLQEKALPFFIDWIIDKVDFIEITAETEQDAHKIFVSMNDRGLSLTPTEMLKGFLLSEIADDQIRNKANDIWKAKILELKDLGKDEDSNFIKNWLRAQYAVTIRESKKGAVNEDFDIIGTTFNKWVRENTDLITLKRSSDYERFVLEEFIKFAHTYIRLLKYSAKFDQEYECVFYNANNNFTLQYQVILATIHPNDSQQIINKKIKVVSCFLDQYLALRVFNFKTMDYSAIKNTMFNLSKKVRRLDLDTLVTILSTEINEMPFKIEGVEKFFLNMFSRRYMLHILARIANYIEKESGISSRFEDYVNREIKNPYDIEHILADHYDQHTNEFSNEEEFQNYRNRFGGLLLLPKDKNRSYNDNKYEEKLEMYFSDNLLARSLNQKCYQNNPSFLTFIANTGLPFKAYSAFTKEGILQRQGLYKEICRKIWNVSNIKLLGK